MSRRRGFTLIELLIVILIIVALVAILLPTINEARRRVARAVVSTEQRVLKQAIASYTADKGGIPPSRFVCSETGDYSKAFFDDQLAGVPDREYLRSRSLGDLSRAFPRARMSSTRLVARDPATPYASNPLQIPGPTFYDFNGNGRLDPAPYLLTGDECLVFFLGGIPQPHADGFGTAGFAKDPRNPFQPALFVDADGVTVTPIRSAPIGEFKAERLFDLDGDGVPSYDDPYGSPSGHSPYAYFAAVGTGSYDPDDCNFAAEPIGTPSPVAGFLLRGSTPASSPAPNPYASSPVLPTGAPSYAEGPLKSDPVFVISWINPNSFQIVSAGADREFGPGGMWSAKATGTKLPFPRVANAEVTGVTLEADARTVERDNIAVFAEDQLD